MQFTSWFSSSMTFLKVCSFPYFLKKNQLTQKFLSFVLTTIYWKNKLFLDSHLVDRQLEDKVEIKDEEEMEDEESDYDEILQIMGKYEDILESPPPYFNDLDLDW